LACWELPPVLEEPVTGATLLEPPAATPVAAQELNPAAATARKTLATTEPSDIKRIGAVLDTAAVGKAVASASGETADFPEAIAAWRPGSVHAPLERLMFDETPTQELQCGVVFDELISSPSAAERSLQEALLRSRAALAAPPSDRPSPTQEATESARSVWFVEQLRGEQLVSQRVPDSYEVYLITALATALTAVPRRPRMQPEAGPTAAAALLCSFRAAVCDADVGDLRCIPLGGDLARRLPPELCDPGISATRLPALRRGGAASLAGSSFARAKDAVEEILRLSGVAIFKIGITCNPLMRWRAYERDGYEKLHLIYTDDQVSGVQMLEACLIDTFKCRSGCQNIARGGEGPVGRGPYFTYLAIATCSDGAAFRRKKRPRLART